MKAATVILLGLIAATCIASALAKNTDKDKAWKEFKDKHKKKYKDAADEARRRKIFDENHDRIAKHNSEKHSYKLAINHLADMDDNERQRHRGEVDADRQLDLLDIPMQPLPRQAPSDQKDLRSSPCMPPVKYQGMCGSCYTFAAVAPLEYQLCTKTGKMTILSEQNLVDCSVPQGNNGCNGGLAYKAWNYAIVNGLNTNLTYPYTATQNTCTYNPSDAAVRVKQWFYATRTQNETEMQIALDSFGPLSVSMDATYLDFYSSGVYDDPRCSNTSTNHAVVLVGYGNDPTTGLNYWIIRNSWDIWWGIEGYMLLTRGKNMCAVAKRVVYPVIY